MNYQLTLPSGVRNLETGAWFPAEDGSTYYEEYKAWLAAGNTAMPADHVDQTAPVWNEFRERRDLYLSRLAGIAGRYQRKADTVMPPACDAISVGLLAMPSDPTLAAIADPQALSTALVTAANQLLRNQLQFLADGVTPRPAADAAAIKAALDQVFKTP